MCFKKDPNQIIYPARLRSLHFTLNDYPGSIPDLSGCDADGKQAKETFLRYWPDWDAHRYREKDFNIKNFRSAVSNSIRLLDRGSVVAVFADSCFSGGLSRAKLGLVEKHHNRFYAQPGIISRPALKTFITKEGITWIVMSGCGPTQYCADAYVDGGWHGIYSYIAFNCLQPGMTWMEWHNEIRRSLPGNQYDQIPVIEGPMELLNKRIGYDQTLIIHNSSHGTQLKINGEIHEAICMYDYNLSDTEYIQMLRKQPA